MNQFVSVATGLCVSVFVISCGGSSSSSNGSSSDEDLINLTPENVDTLSRNAANALPGCTYNSDTAIGIPDNKAAVNFLFKNAYNKIVNQFELPQGNITARAESIDETEAGDCPTDPGSLRTTGTEEDGVQDARITFSRYCTTGDEDGNERTIIDGVVTVKNISDVSGDEPVPVSTEVSTLSNGLDVTAITDEGTFNYVFRIDTLKGIVGNGLEDPTEQNPDKLMIKSASVIDGETNNEYKVSNVDILAYDSGTDEVLKINGITYTDPDTGSVTVTTTPLVTDEDGVFRSGSITLQGSDNSSVTLTRSDTVDNSFEIKDSGGATLGMMDCSNV